MSRSTRSTPARGAKGSRRQVRSQSGKGGRNEGDEKGRASALTPDGRHLPMTSGPSFNNVIAGFYNSLPKLLRNTLPFGVDNSGGGSDEAAPIKDKRGASWQEVCFIHSIPGEDEEEGLVVLADGSMRKYILCRGTNIMLFDEQDRENLARQFGNFVNSCKSDIQILIKTNHMPVDEYITRYQLEPKSDNEYLKWYADYTDKWFRRIQDVSVIPQRDFYVVVSYQPPDCRTGQLWSGRRSIQKHEEYLENLNSMARTAFDQLRSHNLRPRVVTRREVRNLVYADLNPSLAEKEPEAPPSNPHSSEASVLAGSALKLANDHLWVDGKFIGTQYLFQLPNEPDLGWLSELLSLSVEYTVSIFIHQCKQGKGKSSSGRQESDEDDDFDEELDEFERPATSRRAAASIKEFLNASKKTLDVSLYISTMSEKPDLLNSNMDKIRRLFKKLGANIDRAQLMQLDAWQSTLAVGVDKLAIVHRVDSETASTLWPFFAGSCGTPDGVPFGFELNSREPVLLNPFFVGPSKEASNMFVVGSAGAGKSFAVSMMILRLLPMGMRFVLIDKSVDRFGAYRFITDLLGPELCAYIDLGPHTGGVINPFDMGPEDQDASGPSPEKVMRLIELLELMIAPEGSDTFVEAEKSLLDQLIRLAYMEAQIEGTVPTISDLIRATANSAQGETDPVQRERLHGFVRSLSQYAKTGMFGGLLDGPTNIDSEKHFIVFDTREVNDPRLERVMTYVLADFIRRKAADSRERGVRFAAVIDEAASFMRFKSGARYLETLSRNARGYGMMLVAITQQLKDFFRSPDQAESIVDNSQIKLLLRQDPSDMKLLKETLKLRDAEVEAIEQFVTVEGKRKESRALLIVGGVNGAISLVPSPMDYWICTSEPIRDIPKRLKMIQEVKAKNPKLTHTDACRQAAYYLGLRHEG